MRKLKPGKKILTIYSDEHFLGHVFGKINEKMCILRILIVDFIIENVTNHTEC